MDRSSGNARERRQSTWMTWAGIGLSVVCLYVALRGTDLREIAERLSQAHLWLIVPLVIAQVLYFWLKAIRWRLLLKPTRECETAPLVAPMMIGFMGNNLLPAHLGELIRMYLGARLIGAAQSQVLATLVLERMFDFISVLLFFGWGILALRGGVPQALVSAAYVSAIVSAVGMAAVALYVGWTPLVLRIVETATSFVPDRIRRPVLQQLELAASGMAALRNPALLAGIVVTSLAQWLLMAASIYISCNAVDIGAPPAAAFVVLGATVLGVMVPAAPGFFGTLELTFVLALTPFAVGDGRAMAAAVFYHVIPYVGVLLAGMYYLRQTGVRLQEIEREALDAQPVAAAGQA